MRRLVGQCLIELVQGNITTEHVDVIVNAANEQLAGGGGVDGAIHQAGGSTIKAETDRLYPEGCRTGDVAVSTAGNLSAVKVFHTVGPIWAGGRKNERLLLQNCYQRCLELMSELNFESIAFPAISTGVYGYPIDRASSDALEVCLRYLKQHQTPKLIRFVLFSPGAYGAFSRSLQELVPE